MGPPFTYELCFFINQHGLSKLLLTSIQLNLSTVATFGTEESGRCGKVAVVERFKQESMYGLSVKKVVIVRDGC